MFRFLPEQASDFAADVDWLNNLITDLSVFFTVAIVGTMIFFAVKYRQKNGKDHATDQIEGSHLLEVLWTVVPTIICIFIAAYGYLVFKDIRTVPADAQTIYVKGKQWDWDFEYPNGKKTYNEWVVPVDKPVKLVMTSMDVLHSFFVPAMRVKQDLIPKQFSYVWFRPVKTGEYHTFCTEYCGTKHSAMIAKLKVVSQAEYDRWLADDSQERRMASMKPADLGKALYVQKGCAGCHSLDGSKGVGPSFLKVFGKTEELESGDKVVVDEEYIRKSLFEPASQVVKGFAPMSQSFAGQLNDDELKGLIEFIKSIDGNTKIEVPVAATEEIDPNLTPVQRGEKIYQTRLCVTCHSLSDNKVPCPSFKGIYNRKGKLSNGNTYVADDAYLKKAIRDPESEVVEGYQPSMTKQLTQSLSDKDIEDVIEYLKTIK
jgi:cytochrome c oxidase subunit II